MKHAYLIIAHNDPTLLAVLVEMLDDERNDIYILIDKKADTSQFSVVKATKSILIYAPRIDIKWGHISQVEAENDSVQNRLRQRAIHLLSFAVRSGLTNKKPRLYP